MIMETGTMSVCDTDFDSTRASRASSDSDSEPKPDVDASDGPLEVARPSPTRLRRAKKLLAGASRPGADARELFEAPR